MGGPPCSLPLSFPLTSGVLLLSFGSGSSLPLSESANIHRIISVSLEPSKLGPAWVQRILLLLRRGRLLLSVSDTCPAVTAGVGSVARVVRQEALPTSPSGCLLQACVAGRSERLVAACNTSASPPAVQQLPATPQAWHVQVKGFSLSSPLALPVVKGFQRLRRRRHASNHSPGSRAHKDVHQHCVQLICQHSQCVQRHHNFSRCVCFRQLTLFPRPTSRHLSLQGCTLTTKFSVCRAQDTKSLSVFFSGGGLAKTSRVHQGRMGSCWIRRGHRTHRLRKGTVATPSRLGRGLDG